MGYYNGTANDMTALRQALIDACALEGWSWSSSTEVLSKGTMFLQLKTITGPYLTLQGGTSADGVGLTGAAPNAVRVGLAGTTGFPFPITYEVFVFSAEVYLVVNYSVDKYQWAAFGKSTVSGLSGTGMWFGATIGSSIRTNSDNIANISATGSSAGGSNANSGSLSLFWAGTASDAASDNCFVHHNLSGYGWDITSGFGWTNRLGVAPLAPLVALLPNMWNSEAVLLPLRCYVPRASNKISLVADLENSRITRVDNYTPGQVITIGGDRWKIFPWYRKDVTIRNGGYQVNHTGTFGWAIRYEGP